MGHSLEDEAIKNAAAGEFRAFVHHFEERLFAFTADHGCVAEVYYEFAPFKVLARSAPALFWFGGPGVDKLAFDYQTTLGPCVDCGDS